MNAGGSFVSQQPTTSIQNMHKAFFFMSVMDNT